MQGGSLFSSEIDLEEDVDTKELKTQKVKLMMTDTLKDKFQYLDVDHELSASIVSGLVEASGSGRFVEEKNSITSKSSSISLIYRVEQVHQEIDVQDLKKKINFDALNTVGATHVVTGITWGFICTITAQYTFDDIEIKHEIEDAIQTKFDKLKEALDCTFDAIVGNNTDKLVKCKLLQSEDWEDSSSDEFEDCLSELGEDFDSNAALLILEEGGSAIVNAEELLNDPLNQSADNESSSDEYNDCFSELSSISINEDISLLF